jgi:RNA polymerase sigma-70 factor, ECF subfamily
MRNRRMLATVDPQFRSPLASARLPVSVGLNKVFSVQSGPAEAINDQTAWLIAVRDHGDKACFRKLFDHFAPRLKSMLMRRGTGAATAEEIVQETLLAVWRKAAQFDPQRATASSWIYQIARNRAIDMARKERRPLPQELYNDEGVTDEPSLVLAYQQEVELLRSALAKLPEKQRTAVEQAYLGEMSHQEIESLGDVPLGTIKSRIRLGLERLRHSLVQARAQ